MPHTIRPGVQHAKKFVFIGASYKFNHRVIRDFLLTKRFNGSTFTVVDIDKTPLKLVTDLARRMVKQSAQDVKIEGTLDMEAALHGADFVFPAFSVGGDSASERDAAIAFQFGMVSPIGDTVGPGGLVRGLREVPLAVEIAQHLHRYSPRGRIINFTNPLSVITAAMIRHSEVHGVVGLCHEIVSAREFLARLYKVEPSRMEVVSAGVNHLTWVLQVLIDGHDHTDRLDALLGKVTDTNLPIPGYGEKHFKLSLEIWKRYGFMPIAGDEHVAEFFPQFTRRGSAEVKRLKLAPRKGLKKKRIELMETLIDWTYRKEALPDMDKWSGEDAHSVVLSMLDGDNARHTLNMAHDGALGPGIATGAMVECLASVDKRGARGVALGELPPVVKAMTQRLNAVHDLTVEAALEGDRNKVIQALLLDPSVVNFDNVPKMVETYLKEYKRYLPRFWK